MTSCRLQLLFARCCLLFALCLLPVAFTSAQSTSATLSGTVTDPNSAAVVGAQVTVTNNGTGLKRQATTSGAGTFTIPLLPPSTYTVLVQNQGFTPAEIRDVVLNVNDNVSLNIELKVGQVGATVDVKSNAPLISESPAVGTVVDRQFVANIPLNGRSFQSLIGLTPGVVFIPAGGNNTGQFSVNGQRANSNYFAVDGVSANIANGTGFIIGQSTSGSLPGLTTFGGTNSLVSVDAMQEFKIQTSTYAAEYGRSPGAQISIATRSGANQFHGSVFDYFRNEVLDANDWFLNSRGVSKRPPLRQNDFGGVFSGPVLLPRYNGRNKTFFFFSYEGLRLLTPTFTLTNVPSLALRQTAPATMRAILNSFPIPNGPNLTNGFAEYFAGYSNPSTLNATSIRIDHTVNNKLTIFGRYNIAPSHSDSRDTTNLSTVDFTDFDTRTLTFGATMIFTPAISNEIRANYSNNEGKSGQTQDSFGGATPIPREALLPSQYAPVGTTSSGAISIGAFPGFTASGPQLAANYSAASQRQINIIDSVSFTKGSHQFKFGADYRRLMPVRSPRLYSLGVQFLTLEAVQTGTASLVVPIAGTLVKPIYESFSGFAQDTWKPFRRLSLHLGLRWELNPAPHEANGNDPFAITGLDNLATLAVAPQGTPLWKTTYNNFAPRVGVAYQLFQKPGRETVLRGGFGVFYDTGNSQGSAGFEGFPFNPSRIQFNPHFLNPAVPNDPAFVLPLSPAFIAPPPFNRNPPYNDANSGGIITFDPNLKLPYTLQWNFAVEQSLGKSQTITASYVGALGRRLLVRQRLNLAAINPIFATIQLTTNGSTSDYHSLQLQFQRRLARGLQALGSYTWSHAIDTASIDGVTNIVERGNADFDVRHNFAAAVTYDIPAPKFNSFANIIGRDWGLDIRVNTRSALPVIAAGNTYNITSGTITDPVTGTQIARRVNLITGVPFYLYGSQYPGGRIINNTVPTAAQVTAAGCAPLTATNAKGAFCTPPTGRQGTLGRNVVRGFAFWQADIALRRQFNLTEKVNLQFRAEAFNLFNHPNFGTIQTSLSSPTFGQATEMLNTRLAGLNPRFQNGGPRSMQFAVKLQF